MLRIGSLQIEYPVLPAPMAGLSDRAGRTLWRQFGCEFAWTGMISSEGLIRNDPKTYKLLDIVCEPGPVGVQLFGSRPESMARAAQIIEAAGANAIDINMGCPVAKVTRNGAGAALMRDHQAAARILAAAKDAVAIPVTAKIRAGWDDEHRNAVEVAQALEQAGADAITLHPRTRTQGFSHKADWSLIRRLKETVSCPVIGNGDVRSAEDVRRMIAETACDGVMIGRAAVGNPWIFEQCRALIDSNFLPPPPTVMERFAVVLTHARLLMELKPEPIAMREMRRHSTSYLRGLPHSRELREQLQGISAWNDLEQILNGYLERWSPTLSKGIREALGANVTCRGPGPQIKTGF